MKFTREQILGIVRHMLTFSGGLIVAKGIADVATVETIIGSVTTLIGAVWSIVVKKA